MMSAYRAGRMEKDPSTSWFEGEIAFFDHYVMCVVVVVLYFVEMII